MELSPELRQLIGQRLKKARETRGLSQLALGRKAGLDGSYVNKVERGTMRNPTRASIGLLAEALNWPLDDIWPQEPGRVYVTEERVREIVAEQLAQLHTSDQPDDDVDQNLTAGSGDDDDEPLDVVLDRIGAFPLEEEPPIELDQAVAAGDRGTGIIQGGDDTVRRRRRKNARGLYLVRIEGNCLEPRASHGDWAVFNPEQSADNGDLVVVAHGDHALVKYLDGDQAMQYLLPLVGDPIEMVPGMRIVGVVDHIRKAPGSGPRLRR
jgi:transcriptional regulator with XRE-family HTH domain